MHQQDYIGTSSPSSPALAQNGLPQANTRQRYLALDVLRGMTIALMIVVNTPGSWETIYAPFRHAPWHGFTPTDLVFPCFLFVVGNAMSFSMRKFEKQSDAEFLKKVLKRTVLIFLIGLFLNGFPFFSRADGSWALIDFTDIRIMGVLQRIALCYGIAALVINYFKIKGAMIFSGIMLLAYWGVMYYFGDQPDPYSLEANAALQFDLLIFSPDNLYQGYGIPFDPEGLLSTLPAVVNVVIGYLAGLSIQQQGNKQATVGKFILAGTLLIAVALLWNSLFPINKPIWTSSYVLLSSGLVLLILALLVLVIEMKEYKSWTYFFEVFGRNPLFIYVLSGLVISLLGLIRLEDSSLSRWLYEHLFLSWLNGNGASLLFAVSYMLLMWLLGYWMDKKRIYVKV